MRIDNRKANGRIMIDDGITIDISPFVSGKELKIDLETGQLSVVAITNT